MHSPQSQVIFFFYSRHFILLPNFHNSFSLSTLQSVTSWPLYPLQTSSFPTFSSHNQAYSQTLFPPFFIRIHSINSLAYLGLCSLSVSFRYLCNFVHNLIWQIGDSNYSTVQSALSGSGNQARQVVKRAQKLSEQLARDFSSIWIIEVEQSAMLFLSLFLLLCPLIVATNLWQVLVAGEMRLNPWSNHRLVCLKKPISGTSRAAVIQFVIP